MPSIHEAIWCYLRNISSNGSLNSVNKRVASPQVFSVLFEGWGDDLVHEFEVGVIGYLESSLQGVFQQILPVIEGK